MTRQSGTLTINGRAVTCVVEPPLSLADLLRHEVPNVAGSDIGIFILYMFVGIYRVTERAMDQTIAIERVDHIGIRVRDLDRTLAFYRVLGFTLRHRAVGDDVAIVRNEHGVELNLIFNANAGGPDSNILMDVPDKLPGYTHIALRVTSIPVTIAALDIAITQGPVSFGQSGQVSVFVRDPDPLTRAGRRNGRERMEMAAETAADHQ
jgi:lactoylglutathione lyase